MFARIRKSQENNEGGFTLIELLVVMIIIGILSAIAIPTFLSQKQKAREASAKADVKSLATDLEGALTEGNFAANSTFEGINDGTDTGVTSITLTNVVGTESPVVRISKGNRMTATTVVNTSTYCASVATQDDIVYKVEAGQLTKVSDDGTGQCIAPAA